jgi:hypothetical protein
LLRDVSGAGDPRTFLEFIWDGQEGLFELASAPRLRFRTTRTEALQNHHGAMYFGPLARKVDAGRKAAVADVGNVLWADIDVSPGPDWLRGQLATAGITPSATVFSGRGYWIYVKLDRLIPTETIECLNRSLAALLRADSCWERNRLARLPGSINEKSGARARVVDLSQAVHAPDALSLPSRDEPDQSIPDEDLLRLPNSYAQFPAVPRLGRRALEYIHLKPQRGVGYDRSVEEQRIFKALAGQAWTDDEIIAFADAYSLPRHSEERRKRGDYSWTLLSIRKARTALGADTQEAVSIHRDNMCRQSATNQLQRRDVLHVLEGRSTQEIIDFFAPMHNRSTVLRALSQLRASEHSETVRRGRNVINRLTPKGRAVVEERFRRALFLPTLATMHHDNPRVRPW